VTFPCSYCSFPDNKTNVTWYRNGNLMQKNDTHIIHSNGSLEITEITKGVDATVAGLEYHCVVSNEFGSIISRPALIQYASKYFLITDLCTNSECICYSGVYICFIILIKL